MIKHLIEAALLILFLALAVWSIWFAEPDDDLHAIATRKGGVNPAASQVKERPADPSAIQCP